jgi:hypothetical protein
MAGHPPFELPTIDTWEVGHDNISRPPKGTTHVVLDTPAGLHGKMLERVLKLSTRVIVPVQPSLFDMLATRHFLSELLSEKAVRKGKADVAVIGMRVDARTRAAGELERFFATFDLPVLAYLRDTQVYVQATAAGMTCSTCRARGPSATSNSGRRSSTGPRRVDPEACFNAKAQRKRSCAEKGLNGLPLRSSALRAFALKNA